MDMMMSFIFFIYSLVVLRMEPRVWHMLDMHSSTELHAQPLYLSNTVNTSHKIPVLAVVKCTVQGHYHHCATITTIHLQLSHPPKLKLCPPTAPQPLEPLSYFLSLWI
jgi:hypothetical protein